MMDKELIEMLGINTDEIRDQVIHTVSRQIADEIGRDIKSQLKAKSSAAVENLLTDIVDDVANKTFQPVNHWGEPTSAEPTTIKDMMAKSIENWWAQKVDTKGNVDTSSYGTKLTRAEYYAKKVVADHVDATLKLQMQKIVEEGKEQVRLAMAKAIADYTRK